MRRMTTPVKIQPLHLTHHKLYQTQTEGTNTARLAKLKEASAKLINLEKLKKFQESSAAVIGHKKQTFIKFSYAKLTEWYEKYIVLLGLDKVRALQKKVLQIEERLKEVKLTRSHLDTGLKEIRIERYGVDESLRKVDRIRDNEQYIDLIRQEGKIISTEKQLELKLEEAEKLERDTFTELSNAIAKSYEAGREQAEHAKYFGYGLSLMGVVLGAALSYAVNASRTRILVDGLHNGMDEKISALTEKLDGYFQTISSHIAEQKTQTPTPVTSQTVASQTPQPEPSPWSFSKKEVIIVISLCVVLLRTIFGF